MAIVYIGSDHAGLGLKAALVKRLSETGHDVRDLGPATAAKIADALNKRRFEKNVSDDEVRLALSDAIAAILTPVAKPLKLDPAKKPHVAIATEKPRASCSQGRGATNARGPSRHSSSAESPAAPIAYRVILDGRPGSGLPDLGADDVQIFDCGAGI